MLTAEFLRHLMEERPFILDCQKYTYSVCFAQVSLLKVRVYGEKLDTFRQRGRNFYVSSLQINVFGQKLGNFFCHSRRLHLAFNAL